MRKNVRTVAITFCCIILRDRLVYVSQNKKLLSKWFHEGHGYEVVSILFFGKTYSLIVLYGDVFAEKSLDLWSFTWQKSGTFQYWCFSPIFSLETRYIWAYKYHIFCNKLHISNKHCFLISAASLPVISK